MTRTFPLIVGTDGACTGNPAHRLGLHLRGRTLVRRRQASGTNQLGELMAVLLALQDFPDVPLEIEPDST